MIQVYSIPYPTTIDKEDFAGLFFDIDNEGIEEKEATLDIYLNDAQQISSIEQINEICATYQLSYTVSTLENKNWNAQWESSFQPILMDDFVYVRATFHPQTKLTQHEIIIEPKMSFGTGHHATTAQMMQNMRSIHFENKTVLDCGSGTGILAILAEKLGAKNCIALDYDEWCYTNCLENIQLNNCTKIEAVHGEITQYKSQKFDIILANIHRNYLVDSMETLSNCLADDGYLLISGFYESDSAILLNKALEYNLIANYHTTQNNWSCIILQKK